MKCGMRFPRSGRRHARGRRDPRSAGARQEIRTATDQLDIDDVIKEVLALARGELLRHDVVLRTELAAGDQPVMGDRVQLQQVLLNLIMNGVEAMRGVTERTRELTVSSTLAEPSSVLVAVQDTGTGLDRQSRNACSSPSSRQNRTALAWDSPSAGQSSSPRRAPVGIAARAAWR